MESEQHRVNKARLFKQMLKINKIWNDCLLIEQADSILQVTFYIYLYPTMIHLHKTTELRLHRPLKSHSSLDSLLCSLDSVYVCVVGKRTEMSLCTSHWLLVVVLARASHPAALFLPLSAQRLLPSHHLGEGKNCQSAGEGGHFSFGAVFLVYPSPPVNLQLVYTVDGGLAIVPFFALCWFWSPLFSGHCHSLLVLLLPFQTINSNFYVLSLSCSSP